MLGGVEKRKKKTHIGIGVSIRGLLDNSMLKLLECREKKKNYLQLVLPISSPDLAFLGVSIEGMSFRKKIVILTLLQWY